MFRVGNGGVLHVQPGVNVSFYHGDPGAGGVLLGTVQTTGQIYPGYYEDVTLQWDNPPDGPQTIFVKVDDDGTGAGAISESSEDNNQASTTYRIGNTPPVADAGPDRSVNLDETVVLDGSGSGDADGDTLDYQWRIVSMPGGSLAALSDPQKKSGHPLLSD